jgi:hypothetical protein
MSDEINQIDGVLYYPTKFDEKGIPLVHVPLTNTDNKESKNILAPSPYVIPVVFLPGIMGTNLRTSGKEGKVVWRPPNMDMRGAGEVIGALFSYLFKNAAQRKDELAKDAVEIDLRGPIDTAGTGLPENILRERGWGGLMRSSYHPMMGKIQNKLSKLAECGALTEWAKEQGLDNPADWGETAGQPALDKNELMHAACYRFEVWGGGYNWLASNRDSGHAIKTLIEDTILPWYKKNQIRANKVIVVTHSMGGLVSRALTEIHGCSSVLGVVHGVQPATGAPATYKRMRAGFEGPAQVILGRDAGEVTAVLSSAPGGLELLPTFDYNDGQPWLKVREKKSASNPNPKEYLSLPSAGGDPYSEIYSSTEWYGLVPAKNEGLMEPRKDTASKAPSSLLTVSSPRVKFISTIQAVAKFHRDIVGKYFQPTHAHYGQQGKKQGGVFGGNRFAWGELVWEGRIDSDFDPKTASIAKDDSNGEITLTNGTTLAIADPDCPGDGTVPWPSGAAPGKAGAASSFRHGQHEDGQEPAEKHNTEFGYDHQDNNNDDRGVFATLYGIVKIAQKADWHA